MTGILFVTILISIVALIYGAGCPNLTELRTENVVNNLDLNKLSGHWYEVAYHDVAQVGESCQSYDKTITEYGIEENFNFVYRNASSLKLFYENTDTAGFFQRYADYPVANKLKFPSVIVDFTTDRSGEYKTLTEYLCYEVAGLSYQEIRVGARESSVSPQLLASIEATLAKAGLNVKTLRHVNHTAC